MGFLPSHLVASYFSLKRYSFIIILGLLCLGVLGYILWLIASPAFAVFAGEGGSAGLSIGFMLSKQLMFGMNRTSTKATKIIFCFKSDIWAVRFEHRPDESS
jgi:hypothetical protein